MAAITAKDIVEALTAWSSECIWASELDFFTGKRRIDFWTMAPIRSKGFLATAYEIKVSRADYKRDSDQKQSGALAYSDRFYYVTPPSLISKDELPEWAGLIEWDGEKLSTIRRSPVREKLQPSWEFVVSLMRNSGEARRDVGLLKAQISFYETQQEYHKRLGRMNSRFAIDKWREAIDAEPIPPLISEVSHPHPTTQSGGPVDG